MPLHLTERFMMYAMDIGADDPEQQLELFRFMTAEVKFWRSLKRNKIYDITEFKKYWEKKLETVESDLLKKRTLYILSHIPPRLNLKIINQNIGWLCNTIYISKSNRTPPPCSILV